MMNDLLMNGGWMNVRPRNLLLAYLIILLLIYLLLDSV